MLRKPLAVRLALLFVALAVIAVCIGESPWGPS